MDRKINVVGFDSKGASNKAVVLAAKKIAIDNHIAVMLLMVTNKKEGHEGQIVGYQAKYKKDGSFDGNKVCVLDRESILTPEVKAGEVWGLTYSQSFNKRTFNKCIPVTKFNLEFSEEPVEGEMSLKVDFVPENETEAFSTITLLYAALDRDIKYTKNKNGEKVAYIQAFKKATIARPFQKRLRSLGIHDKIWLNTQTQLMFEEYTARSEKFHKKLVVCEKISGLVENMFERDVLDELPVKTKTELQEHSKENQVFFHTKENIAELIWMTVIEGIWEYITGNEGDEYLENEAKTTYEEKIKLKNSFIFQHKGKFYYTSTSEEDQEVTEELTEEAVVEEESSASLKIQID